MSATRPVGVITGIASETRVARMLVAEAGLTDRVKMACAGASSQRAEAHAQTMLAEGVGALVSFGIAGGLDPALRPGDIVLPDAVFTPEHHLLPCAETWLTGLRAQAASLGIGLHPGRLAGSDSLLATPEAKQERRAVSGACAVDMESHSVAQAAWKAKVPFLILRAICDSAASPLPHSVRGCLNAAGEPRVAVIIGRLCLRPWEIGPVRRLQADARTAHRALRALKPLAEALFGGP